MEEIKLGAEGANNWRGFGAGTTGTGLGFETTGGGLARVLVQVVVVGGERGVGRVTVDGLTFKILGMELRKVLADFELQGVD